VFVAVRRGHEDVDGTPDVSSAWYPKSRSAAASNDWMIPLPSITMMPSTAESMIARHWASLAR
jgi:hypothetical protein